VPAQGKLTVPRISVVEHMEITKHMYFQTMKIVHIKYMGKNSDKHQGINRGQTMVK
jgi:hypothetical protein